MTSTLEKLRAINEEVVKKESELRLVDASLQSVRWARHKLQEELQMARDVVQSSQAVAQGPDSEILVQERDLLAKSVSRVQARRLDAERLLAEHLSRDEAIQKDIERAQRELKSASRSALEGKRAVRKAEAELSTVLATKSKLVEELRNSSRRAEKLTSKTAKLQEETSYCLDVRGKKRGECLAVAAQQDEASKALDTLRSLNHQLMEWILAERRTRKLTNDSVVDSTVHASCGVAEAGVGGAAVPHSGRGAASEVDDMQEALIVEYQASIDRLLTTSSQ